MTTNKSKGWDIFIALLGAVFSAILGIFIPAASTTNAQPDATPPTNRISDFFTISINISATLLTIALVLMALITLSFVLRILDILDVFDSDFWDIFH